MSRLILWCCWYGRRIDDVYHGVVKHPLFMVSSFIGVSHKRHPSASSVVVVRHCCRLGRICPSYLLISLCFLSCSMLPCVWKQCLDTYVRFDFLCPSPLMVVTNSLRRCVGAVNAFNALSLPSVFRSWATIRGRRYPLPSIDMVIHRCLSSLSIMYRVLVQQLLSLKIVIVRDISVKRAQSSCPTPPS